MLTRRHTLMTLTAATGTLILPFQLRADGHSGDVFQTGLGPITIHPIAHASFVMETPAGVIYVDPVGDVADYAGLPEPDMILITHEHGDHYNAETLAGLTDTEPHLITNPAVAAMIPDGLEPEALANGDETTWRNFTITAIPAYNITPERLNFHPQGRDNGYVLEIAGFRIYISGDTEDTLEMRALQDIDLAFVCMNLPFTMDNVAAADAVAEFRPGVVYPYHYQGRDGACQDVSEFSEMLADSPQIELRFGDWYG